MLAINNKVLGKLFLFNFKTLSILDYLVFLSLFSVIYFHCIYLKFPVTEGHARVHRFCSVFLFLFVMLDSGETECFWYRT